MVGDPQAWRDLLHAVLGFPVRLAAAVITIAWGLGRFMDLTEAEFRSVVVTASMAPGANAYLFAAMYGRATRVAASAVLLGTALSIVTAAVWLALLS